MTPSNYQRTRWLTLIGTIITQFALGSVYTWSLFNGALSAKLDAPVSQVAFSFGLLSLGLAISSSVAGKLQERFGVKRVTIASGILLGLGFFLTAHSDNLMMLWLSAGVLVGLADGAGYLLTLSNCVKWFPERKGLISAFAIGSYGLGSLGFQIYRHSCWKRSVWKNLCDLGSDCAGDDCFRRNVNERRTKTGSEKPAMVWWRKITRWQSRCVNRSTGC